MSKKRIGSSKHYDLAAMRRSNYSFYKRVSTARWRRQMYLSFIRHRFIASYSGINLAPSSLFTRKTVLRRYVYNHLRC